MAKAILFTRASTFIQDTQSQIDALKAEALRCGYREEDLIQIDYHESAISKEMDERLGLIDLKKHIDFDKSIDCVFVYEISRLSRKTTMLYQIRDYLIDNQIQLICCKPYMRLLENGKMSQTASILFSLFSTMSESEMMIKKERFKRGKQKLVDEGKKAAGAVIFGYMKDEDKRCVAHPLHSKMVVDIFKHYVDTQDTSLYETYKWASNKWPETFPLYDYVKAQHKIRNILVKEIYWKGNWCYKPLVTQELADKAKEKMSKAQCKPRYKCKRELLCRGKIYCGHCGKMMTGAGGNVKAYCCSTDKNHNLQVNIDAMDWLMWEEARVLVNFNATIDNSNKTIEIDTKIREKDTEIEQTQRLIDINKSKEEKLLDLYIENKIDKEMLNKRMTVLSAERESYEANINKLTTEKNELTSIIEETQKEVLSIKAINVDSMTNFENKLELVRKYIDRMIATKIDDYVQLEFKYATGTIIIQRGVYRYKNLGGWKHIWRINEDDTIDLILKEKKIR